ncbi:MAG TPA: PEP-CTERM sorting domain-containing protein [Albitalea sp.]|nr:PEP-CTERM sorting domain-containing protein [Albitalea sp.]
MTKNCQPSSRPRPRALIARVLIACCALSWLSMAGADRAWATSSSFSQSLINDIRTSTPPESNGTTSSAVSDGPNSAASFLLPAVGTMGAAVRSDGSVVGVSTSTTHSDDWICGSGASCAAAGPIDVTIDFDASFSGAIGEFSLVAQYDLGGSLFNISVGADSSPVTAGASWGGEPVEVLLTPDPVTNITHVSTHFVGRTGPTSCNGSAGPCGIFSDRQFISLEMEGNGFVDASHTFAVSLAPANPAIALTSADGRTAGSVVGQVPEPASYVLLAVGVATLVASRRGRR